MVTDMSAWSSDTACHDTEAQILCWFSCWSRPERGKCTCELEVHVVALAAVRHEAQLPADALPPADHDRLLQHAAQLEPVQGKTTRCSSWVCGTAPQCSFALRHATTTTCWRSGQAQKVHQCVVGCPGAVLSQRCRVVPANSTSNQHATPCTAQAQPAGGQTRQIRCQQTPPACQKSSQLCLQGARHSMKQHRLQANMSIVWHVSTRARTDLQVQGDGDVVQLLLLDGPKIIQLCLCPRHQH